MKSYQKIQESVKGNVKILNRFVCEKTTPMGNRRFTGSHTAINRQRFGMTNRGLSIIIRELHTEKATFYSIRGN